MCPRGRLPVCTLNVRPPGGDVDLEAAWDFTLLVVHRCSASSRMANLTVGANDLERRAEPKVRIVEPDQCDSASLERRPRARADDTDLTTIEPERAPDLRDAAVGTQAPGAAAVQRPMLTLEASLLISSPSVRSTPVQGSKSSPSAEVCTGSPTAPW